MSDKNKAFDDFDWETLLKKEDSKGSDASKTNSASPNPPKSQAEKAKQPQKPQTNKPAQNTVKPNTPQNKPPAAKPNNPQSKPSAAKPSTPQSKPPAAKPSTPPPTKSGTQPLKTNDTGAKPSTPPVKSVTPPPPPPPPKPSTTPEKVEDEFDDETKFGEERDYMPVKFRRDGKVGCLGGIMYAIFVISVSVILAALAWMGAADVLALNKEEIIGTVTLPEEIFTEKEVEIENADGTTQLVLLPSADMDYVAEQLKNAGIIEYEFLFKLYSQFSSADIQIDPGTFELSTVFDYRAIVKKMTTGSPSQVTTKITFPEGYTMEEMFNLLEENNICDAADLYESAANSTFSYSFIDDAKLGQPERLEGLLFPDTYEFYEGESPYSILNKMLYNFYYRFTAEMISDAERKGLTVHQLITIASMIEKEATSEDRHSISSVIYNRLNAGMKLEIDATIQYMLPERVPQVLNEHLLIDSPYNTYMYAGLPPSPIANPGMASIEAALNPISSGYYYYALNVATKQHEFFTNAGDHGAFVATQDYSAQ